MSQQGLSLDEEVHSPDIFSDSEVVHSPELQNLDECRNFMNIFIQI